ncbi:MAG TPA: DNA-binding protein [Syntrophales bacterium]|nr:DNA-binding protein [Syntrophales bacterium]HPC31523.1 DNA-binding protein [Syntrophales bacterium]HQG34740.1 DNA-binding protein [Syntrophales bacterium]HQI34826.1 DNA-binding protein [Syntrophales bacterium]HQJ30309.1 DNA-binding protein [Syntrophales bacterium]
MKYEKAQLGRVFVLRLEDGEIVHETIEAFAREQGIRAAALLILGGADNGSSVVVGPREDRLLPVIPMTHILTHAHETVGTGTLFPDEDGNPLLHMHMACGRGEETVTGCIRSGVKVWRVMEVIVFELSATRAVRRPEPPMDFRLLQPG